MKDVHLAILNITSWAGQCADATHVYGKLILSVNKDVNIDNVEEWNVNYLGEVIEIKQVLTEKIAKELDKKDGGKTYQRDYHFVKQHPELIEKRTCIAFTGRFNDFNEIVKTGVEKWKELDIKCPFISLYNGEKYISNEYEPSSTIILQYGEKL